MKGEGVKMLQQVLNAPENIIFREIPIPEVKEGQVLIKIHKIGICGTDIRVFEGECKDISYPVTQGREAAGEIVAVGSEVQNLFPGQKVTVQPQIACGYCRHCQKGKYNLCEKLKILGFQRPGMAAEYFLANADSVATLPKDISYEEGTMIEHLAVAVHAVKKAGNITGKKVLVLGAGPVGVVTAQAARGMGAASVMITDISEARLKIAKESGIDFCVNTAVNDLGDALERNFGSQEVCVVYDCAGTNVTISQAVRYAGAGSRIILVAVFRGMASVDLAALEDKELKLYTTHMYRNEDYLDAISLVDEKRVNLKALISKHFSFREYAEAYRYIIENRDRVMKVIIDVQ